MAWHTILLDIFGCIVYTAYLHPSEWLGYLASEKGDMPIVILQYYDTANSKGNSLRHPWLFRNCLR